MTLPPFQILLDEHAAGVMRLLVSRVGHEGAEDCFQETFLSALRAYPHLASAENLRAWLYTIAERKAVDLHRRRGRGEQPVPDVPEGAAEDAEAWDPTLWRRVDALPRRQRMAVALRYACDLSYADIARLDGGSEGAARRNVHAGLARLRKEIEP